MCWSCRAGLPWAALSGALLPPVRAYNSRSPSQRLRLRQVCCLDLGIAYSNHRIHKKISIGEPMKHLRTFCLVGALIFVASAFAQTPAAKPPAPPATIASVADSEISIIEREL